jgi:hypothetical protein
MEFDGALGQLEFRGHTAVAPTLRQRAEHVTLTCGQRATVCPPRTFVRVAVAPGARRRPG